MLEETPVAESQADEANQSQADTTDAANSQAESNSETISLDEAKKLRSEASNLRKRLKDAEGEVEKFKSSQLTESEKLQKQFEDANGKVTKLSTNLQNVLLERAVEEIGKPLGIRSAKTISKFVEREALEFDLEKLSVVGLQDELKRLKTEYPDLFIEGSGDGGRGNGDRPGAAKNMNDIIRGKLNR